MRLSWLLTALLSGIILVVAEFWAIDNALFWYWRWFDTPMHVLGGFVLGAFAVGVLRPQPPLVFGIIILIGAVAWEIFELMTSAPQPNPYFIDTIHDLVNDSLGAMFALALAYETIWRSR